MQAPHLSVGTPYKTDAVTNVQPRGVSMIMSSDNPAAGVPYGMMPQLTTLQIGSSVSGVDHGQKEEFSQLTYFPFLLDPHSTSVRRIRTTRQRRRSSTRCRWAIRSRLVRRLLQTRLTPHSISMVRSRALLDPVLPARSRARDHHHIVS